MAGKNTPSRKATAHKGPGLPRGCADRNDGVEGAERIQPGRHRKLQVARTGSRKLFGEAGRKVFLEWFAATCNVSLSAEKAGFNYKTVLRHRMNDERFAEAWDRAVRQGYARLEAKQLETKRRETPIGIEGDWDAPEMEDMDPQLALHLLREHKREVADPRAPRKQGRRPKVASNAEVREALTKRLKAFHARERARLGVREDPPRNGEWDHPAQPDGGGGPGGSADIPALGPHHPDASRRGPPPRSGEDLE